VIARIHEARTASAIRKMLREQIEPSSPAPVVEGYRDNVATAVETIEH
jgi:hypothetical protein